MYAKIVVGIYKYFKKILNVLNCYIGFFLEGNNDLNTLKIVEVYIRLIQDGLININHLINLLQFVKMVNHIIIDNLYK